MRNSDKQTSQRDLSTLEDAGIERLLPALRRQCSEQDHEDDVQEAVLSLLIMVRAPGGPGSCQDVMGLARVILRRRRADRLRRRKHQLLGSGDVDVQSPQAPMSSISSRPRVEGLSARQEDHE
jgi:DNA-directed RNA polymerase specialized sigma24 family protein